MIDKEKIPEPAYKELIELFGVEEAEKTIIENHYNFRALSLIIIEEKFIKFFRLENLRTWLKKYTGLSLYALLIIVITIGFTLYIFLKL